MDNSINMRIVALVSAMFAASLISLTSGQGVACVEKLVEDVAACFQTAGLDLAMSGQQDATQLMRETQAMDPSVQCASLDVYKNAIKCSLSVLRQCLDTVNMGGSIPDSEKFEKGMQAICDRQEEFDSDCFKHHYPHILLCGEETVKEVVQQKSDNLNMQDIICLSADVNYDCSKKHLQACGKETMSIYLEQLNKYQVPAACVSRPPGRAGRDVYVSGDAHSHTDGANTVVLGSLAAAASLALHLILLQ